MYVILLVDTREVTMRKDKNKLLYTLSSIVISMVFLVMYLSGPYLKKQIFVDVIPKQPTNHIRGIEGDPVNYVYTTDKTYGNYIYMINQFPIADEVGKVLEGQYKTFDFKLEFNEKAVGIKYVISLERMSESNLREDWVKVYLTNEGKGVNCYRNSGRIKTFDEYQKYNGKKNEIILYSGVVTDEDVKKSFREYRFRMWVSDDAEITDEFETSKTFVARVNVHATGDI